MPLVRKSPFRKLLDVEREFSKMLDQSWNSVPTFADVSSVDMYTEDGKLITKVALPDFKKNEIEVTAMSEGLEISAEHKEKEGKEKRRNTF